MCFPASERLSLVSMGVELPSKVKAAFMSAQLTAVLLRVSAAVRSAGTLPAEEVLRSAYETSEMWIGSTRATRET